MRENVGRFARRALANRRQISGISCKSLYKYERRRFTAESLNWDQRVNLQYLESEKQKLVRPRGVLGPVADIEELNASDKCLNCFSLICSLRSEIAWHTQ